MANKITRPLTRRLTLPVTMPVTRVEGVGGRPLVDVPDLALFPNAIYAENQRVAGTVYQTSSAENATAIMRDNSGTGYFFHVKQGEKEYGSVSSIDRAELSGNASQFDYGTEFDFSWQFGLAAIDATYPTLGTVFVNCGQMHNNAGSPCITFIITNDNTLTIRTRSGTSGAAVAVDQYVDSAFQRGKLYPIRMKGRVDPDDTHGGGYLQVWINGRLVVNYTGAIGYTDQTATYWKWGGYRSTTAVPDMGIFMLNMNTDATSKASQVGNPDPVSLGGALVDMMKIESITDGSHANGIWNFTADAATFTQTDVPIGTAMADRGLILPFAYVAGAPQDMTSVSIQPKDGVGGNNVGSAIAGSIQRKAGGSAATVRVGLASAVVPVGTYADITWTPDGTLSNLQVAPLRVQGRVSNSLPGATAGTDITLSAADWDETGDVATNVMDGVNLDTTYGFMVAVARIGAASSVAQWRGDASDTETIRPDKVADVTPEGSVTISVATKKIVQRTALTPRVKFSLGTSSGRLAAGVWQ